VKKIGGTKERNSYTESAIVHRAETSDKDMRQNRTLGQIIEMTWKHEEAGK
jgi:hypothetical protein